MRIVFLTCYYNHHQSELAEALYQLTDGEFHLIETDEVEEERLRLGWSRGTVPPYVLQYKADCDEMDRRILDADLLIWGSAPKKLVAKRLRAGKLTLKYSERLFKKGTHGIQFWGRAIKYYLQCRPNKNLYLLSAGAYAASDYKRIHAINNAYCWGYFPPFQEMGGMKKPAGGENKPVQLLWAGRLIDWKHPEYAVELAGRLVQDGCRFELDIIGTGDMEQELNDRIRRESLNGCVRLLGAMKPEEVRQHMVDADIFLFTSDRNEGWGAVLNEAMNSQCAIVACDAIGAVPYLIRHLENGMTYQEGAFEQMVAHVEYLLETPAERLRLGLAAYKTIHEEWNAEVAAKRLIELVNAIEKGERLPYPTGPCSEAPILTDYQRDSEISLRK